MLDAGCGVALVGVVLSGRREAAGFLSVPWVAEQLREKAGIDPYPGTLNLRLTGDDSRAAWLRVRASTPGIRLSSPDPAFCDAVCYRVRLEGQVEGVIVLPGVDGYPDDVLEVVAPVRLRDRFCLSDGDECHLEFPE